MRTKWHRLQPVFCKTKTPYCYEVRRFLPKPTETEVCATQIADWSPSNSILKRPIGNRQSAIGNAFTCFRRRQRIQHRLRYRQLFRQTKHLRQKHDLRRLPLLAEASVD